eukprot:UN04189
MLNHKKVCIRVRVPFRWVKGDYELPGVIPKDYNKERLTEVSVESSIWNKKISELNIKMGDRIVFEYTENETKWPSYCKHSKGEFDLGSNNLTLDTVEKWCHARILGKNKEGP